MIQLCADGISLAFDPRTGLLDGFKVEDQGVVTAPLHRAPWVGTGEVLPEGLSPHTYTLGGDFFCAPFAQAKDGAPPHGWPANSHWALTSTSPDRLSARLEKRVNGAELTKELWLCDGHPFVYQRHTFIDGAGELPVSNHANLSLLNGGLIRTSAKQVWMTPPTALEPDPKRGRSGLKYPAKGVDPAKFPAAGGTADLTRYPWFPAHEDFVVGVEAPGHMLGWTAVTRPVEGDLFLSLRRADALPMTMLWHSNGGRDYAPWSGRHIGCLGVEEGAADHMLGPDHGVALTGPGKITLAQGSSASVSHAIGAIAWPDGSAVASVDLTGGDIVVTGESGVSRTVPFDAGIFELA